MGRVSPLEATEGRQLSDLRLSDKLAAFCAAQNAASNSIRQRRCGARSGY